MLAKGKSWTKKRLLTSKGMVQAAKNIVVQSLSHVLLSVTPWAVACQASLSFYISWSLLKLMSIESVMPSNHLSLCCSLLLLPSIFPKNIVFRKVQSHE